MASHLNFHGLYPILDCERAARRRHDLLACARGFAALGLEVQQLRAKTLPAGELLRLADGLRAVVPCLIVNDRPDVALLSGAAGVHLGQSDLPVEEVRRLSPPGWITGLSTHNPGQIAAALALKPSYLALGPIFSTTTKWTHLALPSKAARRGARAPGARSLECGGAGGPSPGARAPWKVKPDPVVGVQALTEVRKHYRGPLMAIGGIQLGNCAQAWQAGADAVAVISALWDAPDPVAEAHRFLLAFARLSCHSPGESPCPPRALR
ncbi:MAG: thiamine phosphate synthase [Terriglobales bacterium]